MHPAFRSPCTRGLLAQSGKTIATQLARTYTDRVDGIKLPPEPTTCCMSGCANCVWIDYAETLSKLFDGNDEKAKEIILNKITDPNLRMFLNVELKYMEYKGNGETNSRNLIDKKTD